MVLLQVIGVVLLVVLAPRRQASSEADVEQKIRAGRQLLQQERPVEAEQLFIEAEVLSGKQIHARKWIWRAWMQAGRVNDALNEIDSAEANGKLAPEDLDYLRGMAMLYRGRQYLNQGVGEPFTSQTFRDATAWLARATHARSEAFEDAWLALAECAWQVQEYATGRRAAEQALRAFPEDARGALLLGRILFQRYLALCSSADSAGEANELWLELLPTLQRALAILGTIETAAEKMLAADAWLQTAYIHLHGPEPSQALPAFVEAIALWPGGVDFTDLWARLSRADFSTVLEAAALRVRQTFPAASNEDATVWWWLGTARYALTHWPLAGEAFELSVRKWPAYAEAWYWAALARARCAQPAQAVQDLLALESTDRELLTSKLKAGGAEDLAILNELIEHTRGQSAGAELKRLEELRSSVWPDHKGPNAPLPGTSAKR